MQVVYNLRIAQVEFDELEVALPALVPEAIAVRGIAVVIRDEPVAIALLPAVSTQVLEGPEAATDMVQHGVEHHVDAALVQRGADLGEIFVGT